MARYRFRSTVSPTAFRLAAYLSAAPLSLPVIRLVQRVVLPDSRPAHLAEVFLSGLLVRVGGQPADLDPDEVEYDFAPGTRALLLSHLSQPEALRVLRRVSEYVSARMGSGVDFPALLADPELAMSQPLGKPFASVLTTVLRRLGGSYRSLADRLEGRLVIPSTNAAEGPPAADPSGTGELVRPTAAPLVVDPLPTSEQPRVWKNVPPRNPNFVGRTELIERLRTRLGGTLTAVVPQALHGLGGVGKTQLVVEYVYRHATDYDLVCWVAAEDLRVTAKSSTSLLTWADASASRCRAGSCERAAAANTRYLRPLRPPRARVDTCGCGGPRPNLRRRDFAMALRRTSPRSG